MLREILNQAELEAKDQRESDDARRRAWRAYHEARSQAVLDSLVAAAERTHATFRERHQQARAQHGCA